MTIRPHHRLIQKALDRTMLPPGDPEFISRLIINMPPGYSKTQIACIHYIARGLAINPMSRFLHLSFSDTLAARNSDKARSIVKSKLYQSMWPVNITKTSDSKHEWCTESGGEVIARSAFGEVTGNRAGHIDTTKFTGSIIVDDPVKPDDVNSEVLRRKINENYPITIASRVAIESIPIILIMQRLHWDDMSGYLLRGGSGEEWHHLSLPVIVRGDEKYPAEYTHGIQIPNDLGDGWLWPEKHNQKHERALRSHRRRFFSQYMQAPIKRDEESALWTEKMINNARVYPDGALDEPIRTLVSVDPATTNNATSDENGIVVGSHVGDNLYSIHANYTKKASPKGWADIAIAAYHKHDADGIVVETNQGGDAWEQILRDAGYKGRVIPVRASRGNGKTARAEPVAALYEMGYIKHRNDGINLGSLEEELLDFDPLTGKSNGKSPNGVDALVWLIVALKERTVEFKII